MTLGALGLGACNSSAMLSPPSPSEITVTVTSPAPGAELLAGERSTIAVSGTVAAGDAADGALEAWVNGVRVDVVDGAFSAELTPEVGVNHIKVEGGNGLGDLVAQELDVLWAPEYLPPIAGQTGFDLAHALELRLGQRFFDARLLGTTLDLSTDPVVARDVASAVELILRQVDLKALIAGPLLPPGGPLDLTITAVTPTDIIADARIVDSPTRAIDLDIGLFGVFLGMQGQLTVTTTTGTTVLTIDGGITVDLHASARLTLETAADGSLAVGLTDVTASISQPVPDFHGTSGEALDGLITTIGSDFRTRIEGLITTQLIPTFTGGLPPLLQSLLASADQLLHNLQFPIDPGFGTPVTVTLAGHMGALDVGAGATAGHVTVSEDLSVQAAGSPIHPASRGAARIDASGAPPAFNTSGLHLMVRMDFLNALLHALWNAGLLEGQLTFGNLMATVSAKLPPIVRPTPVSSPCKIDGERCDLQLELGQLEVALPAFGQSFAINASAGARIVINGGTVSLAIEMVPELRVWETSAEPGSLTPDTVRDLIANLVWPQLFGAIGNNLTIALPLPDLASLGLGGVAPGLADAKLMLQIGQRPSFTGGLLVLGADLSLATAPPP
ncbi:MAG TPA: hypothetical protein VFT22_23650 [Kofleriaceae bacterium]|nr:hypothetical protein [Kofleriaceae bacterium]